MWEGIQWDFEEKRRAEWIDVSVLDLSGALDVSDFSGLRWLYCVGNQLTELDVSGSSGLQHLYFSYNQISEIDVSNHAFLENLLANHNNLTELDITNNPELQELHSGFNPLTVLDVSNNPKLEQLHASAMGITKLDVSNNPLLKELTCNNNKLSDIDVSNNPLLEILSVQWNIEINEIDISNNPELYVLNAYGLQLTELDVSKNPLLEFLNIGWNQINKLDVSKNPLLRGIDIRWNAIEDISSFSGLEDLWYADISNNFIDVEKCEDTTEIIEGLKETIDKSSQDSTVLELIEEYKTTYLSWILLDFMLTTGFVYKPQGRVMGDFDDILEGGVTVTILLQNGRKISIEPERITAAARETDLNIEIQITSQGNQVNGVPANSIVILPFDHGEFGFEMSFVITAAELAEAGLNGANARLWHIDEDGKVVEDGRTKRNDDGSMTIGISRASFYVLSENQPAFPEPPPPPNNNDRIPVTTVVKYGYILGNKTVGIGDALEVLKFLANMNSVIKPNTPAMRAACVTPASRKSGKPGIGDALEILKKLAGMKSLVK